MEDLNRKLRKKLASEEKKNELRESRGKHENKYIVAAILFFGTLVPLYLLLFAAMFIFRRIYGPAVSMMGDVSIAWILPLFHGAIWVATVVSVYRKRSILDDFFDRF